MHLPPRAHGRALSALLLFARFRDASENQSKTASDSQEETQEISVNLVKKSRSDEPAA
jgi:hypothetical protein